MKRSVAVLLLVVATALPAEAVRVALVGDGIPSRYSIGPVLLFHESDSLYLNGRLLARGVDYTFDGATGAFDLSTQTFQATDSLVISYHAAPAWLRQRYGRELPSIVPARGSVVSDTPPRRTVQASPASSGLSLSGAKSFRFNARSAGSSDFGQSLDLTISGELTPGLSIRGAVSDRGYDPAYGTANSRLNELNKINLELESSQFQARIGDIEIENRLSVLQTRSKRIAGAWATVRDPSWYVEGAAARPKGLLETARLSGEDGVQGPYRIGSRSGPIVPGSEVVWLDGRRLERGSNNDYTMDYPAGTITFTVNHPIDRRRRIEVDFEPQATDYREELLTAGGGIALADSVFTFETGWLREGDDRDESLIGELSESDRGILAGAGDSTTLTYRSGVRSDSTGSYGLVVDSLPDSVYQYVGEGAGEYAVTFSFVGTGEGAYRNLGSNRFTYVGAGGGEYLPVVLLEAPEQSDQYVARGGWRNATVGEVSAEFRRSEFDRNLFSEFDDGDNAGGLYALAYDRGWGRQGGGVDLRTRFREGTFRTRERLYEPEFNRKQYLPTAFVSSSDEWWHEARLVVSPFSGVSIAPSGSLLRYDDGTESMRAGVRGTVVPHERIELEGAGHLVHTDLATGSGLVDGGAASVEGLIRYKPDAVWEFESGGEYDRRTNEFTGIRTGTQYRRFYVAGGQRTEQVRAEHYVEDTLVGGWREALSRTRLELRSARRVGDLSYSSMAAYQWLDQQAVNEESFLGRLSMQYTNVERRLSVHATYLLSDETRNVRGLTYLKVEEGRGDYLYVDGQYVPDPDGDYLRVEEILSDRAAVSRGEKSFYISKDWRVALVRITTQVEEELLESGRRSALWGLPFYSDPDEAYQFYTARETGEARFFPIRNAHAINIEATQSREIRTAGGSNQERRDRKGTLTLRQVVRQTHFEQSVTRFDADRDAYYSGAGVIDGWGADVGVRQGIGGHEVSAGTGYRMASSDTGEESQQFLIRGGARLAVVSTGEMRTSVELYRQDLVGVTGFPSYTLTENRSGTGGADWSVELRYGLRKDFRMSLKIGGRHSDDRTARITARGEMVAGF